VSDLTKKLVDLQARMDETKPGSVVRAIASTNLRQFLRDNAKAIHDESVRAETRYNNLLNKYVNK
jgi:hypothetical protein